MSLLASSHRITLIASALVICTAAAALPALTAAADAAVIPRSALPAVRYVALGDSYSSGVGSGDYYRSGGSCERSPGAYSALWAAASHPASYVSEACSGATIGSVLRSQLVALNKATTLVSITIGGNDVGFGPVMSTCVILPTPFCVHVVTAAEAEIRSVLPGQLNELLAAVSADAPNARVVVMGYPEPYDLSRSASCIGLSATDRNDLDHAAAQLDAQLQAAASLYGDEFADVRSAFGGHQICDSDSWMNSVDWLDIGASYHPNPAGQADAYYQVFSAAAR
ncbi:MAG: SGNH/GDSL hydrolase family protein [Streptosporangiaceae bacterium]